MKSQTTSTTRSRHIVRHMLTLVGALFLFAVTAQASTYTVTNTNDSGAGSLRQAVTNANADPFSVIRFNIPGAGVKTIVLNSQLRLEQTVTIDGYTQPGSSANTQVNGSNALPLIELKSANPGSNTALTINVSDCVIRGLVINNFDVGISINGTIQPGGFHTTITGCFIGTNAAGNLAAPNTYGILVNGSSDNIIGGVSLSARNLISGNTKSGISMSVENGQDSKNNLVAGNLIGTDKSGTGAIGNGDGISLYQVNGPNTIGAAPPLARNVISGNVLSGISLSDALNTLVIGNYIGTNAAGTGKVGNSYGVSVEGFSISNKIGASGAGNLISGNKTYGIRFGVCIGQFCPVDNQVAGNLIGTSADGTSALGNTATGIFMQQAGTLKNTIGGTAADQANVIAFNGAGVISFAGIGNAIQRNSIFSNTGPGIDLRGSTGPSTNDLNDPDTGPNNLQNFPVVSSAFSSNGITTLIGTLNSEDSKSYRLEFFINSQCHGSGFGEGKTFVATTNVTTSGNNASFNVSFPGFNLNQFVTATATDPNGNTSEFSPCRQVQAGLPGSLAFSASNYSVAENGGVASLTVLRTGGSVGAVSVQYATTNGTATPNADYTPVSGTLNWADGDSAAKTFYIPLTNDQLNEPDETVGLVLSNPGGGAGLGTNSAVLTITDDDLAPSLSISDVSLAEGNSGTTSFVFDVTMSTASGQAVTIGFATLGSSATLGSDFQLSSGTLTFNPGETSKPITVLVNGDAIDEPSETFVVSLSNPSNATIAKAQGAGTIINDDAVAGPVIAFSQANYSVAEQLGVVTVTVIRSGDTSAAATVDYATSDGTAKQEGDFEYAAGRLTFAPGEVTATVEVLLNQDSHIEGNESFTLVLSNPAGASLGQQSSAQVEITDDVPESVSSPIDDAQSFVHMHYHDFLNREPDQAGMQFWTNQIASCGSNQTCIDVKRVNVSAAYFLSVEFQQTGYLLYLFQKESFASLPKYQLFMRDLQEVSRGIVVNSPGWEQKLAANQQQFAQSWVERPSFKAAYDGMSNVAYVDALYLNAGVVPPQAERDALITALDTASQTRADVLLAVTNNAAFRQQEQNSAFVLMQYFGYLRRDPDSGPDSDLSGYYFWLAKLNKFNGNFQQAEMVRAFLVSSEYRGRFGQ